MDTQRKKPSRKIQGQNNKNNNNFKNNKKKNFGSQNNSQKKNSSKTNNKYKAKAQVKDNKSSRPAAFVKTKPNKSVVLIEDKAKLGEYKKHLLLKKYEQKVIIEDTFVRILTRRTYHNDSAITVNISDVIPVLPNAALLNFIMFYDNKMYHGRVHNSIKNKEIDRNLPRLKITRRRDNICQATIFNFLPNNELTIEIEQSLYLVPNGGFCEFYLPAHVTPRYVEKMYEIETSEFIDCYYLGEKPQIEYSASIDLRCSGMINYFGSETHKYEVDKDENNQKRLTFNLEEGLFEDIHFKYLYDKNYSSIVEHNPLKTGNYFFASIFKNPEIIENEDLKEYIFVFDSSVIDQTYKAQFSQFISKFLPKLNKADKFNVISYGNKLQIFSQGSTFVNEKRIEQALEFVNSIKIEKNSDLLSLCNYFLREDELMGYQREIFLFSSALVEYDLELYRKFSHLSERARFNTFAIGNSPNLSLLTKLSNMNEGMELQLNSLSNIDEVIEYISLIKSFSSNRKISIIVNGKSPEKQILQKSCLRGEKKLTIFGKCNSPVEEINYFGSDNGNYFEGTIQAENIKKGESRYIKDYYSYLSISNIDGDNIFNVDLGQVRSTQMESNLLTKMNTVSINSPKNEFLLAKDVYCQAVYLPESYKDYLGLIKQRKYTSFVGLKDLSQLEIDETNISEIEYSEISNNESVLHIEFAASSKDKELEDYLFQFQKENNDNIKWAMFSATPFLRNGMFNINFELEVQEGKEESIIHIHDYFFEAENIYNEIKRIFEQFIYEGELAEGESKFAMISIDLINPS